MTPIMEYYLLQLYEVITYRWIYLHSKICRHIIKIKYTENKIYTVYKCVYIYTRMCVCVCVCVCVKMQVAQSGLTLCDPMDYTVHGILQARILDWVAFHFSRGSSLVNSLPAESQGKPKNTGVGSLSFLQ